MADEFVGKWVRRIRGDRRAQETRWHYVQSQIEDRVVTKCGRQMKQRVRVPAQIRMITNERRDDVLEVSNGIPFNTTCVRCDPW